MALETATHIANLVSTNPAGGDDLSQGDDHLRMIKQVLLTDLPLDAPATALGMNILKSANGRISRQLLGASNNPFRNRIINGTGATIDQRSSTGAHTVIANQPLAYQYDRFYAACTGGNVTLSGKTFTGSAANASLTIGTRIESVNCGVSTGFVNTTTFTLSALILSSSVDIAWAAYSANSTNTFGTIASPTRTLISSGTFFTSGVGLASLYLASFTLNSSAGNGIEIVFSCGALGAAQTVSIIQAQLEEGQISTDAHSFEIVDPSTQLNRCNRYYRNVKASARGPASGAGQFFDSGLNWDEMRATPTSALVTAGTTSANATNGGIVALSNIGGRFTVSSTGAGDCFSVDNVYSLDAEIYT